MPITRKPGQSIRIGDDIVVTVVAVDKDQPRATRPVRIRVDTPEGVVVVPEEAARNG